MPKASLTGLVSLPLNVSVKKFLNCLSDTSGVSLSNISSAAVSTSSFICGVIISGNSLGIFDLGVGFAFVVTFGAASSAARFTCSSIFTATPCSTPGIPNVSARLLALK